MYWKYAVKRAIWGVAVFVIIIFILSALFDSVLEETVNSQITEQVNEAARSQERMTVEERLRFEESMTNRLRHQYHLDVSSWERIPRRALDILTLDFGNATTMRSTTWKVNSNDVRTIVLETVPNTILLFTVVVAIDVFIGLFLGILKAGVAGGIMDKVTSIGTMVVYGIPTWWFAMVTILIFAYTLEWCPSGGIHSTPIPTGFSYYTDILKHMVLPVCTLVLIGFWGRAYLTRNIVLSTLQDDYIMSARARGIPERKVLFGHTLRSSAPPLMTMAILSLLLSISGSIITEGVFSWPGMGNLYWGAISTSDVPVIMGNVSITTGLYIFGLVVLDLIYGFLDPRIRVGGRR